MHYLVAQLAASLDKAQPQFLGSNIFLALLYLRAAILVFFSLLFIVYFMPKIQKQVNLKKTVKNILVISIMILGVSGVLFSSFEWHSQLWGLALFFLFLSFLLEKINLKARWAKELGFAICLLFALFVGWFFTMPFI
jgi:hypothetical protein